MDKRDTKSVVRKVLGDNLDKKIDPGFLQVILFSGFYSLGRPHLTQGYLTKEISYKAFFPLFSL